MTFAPVPVADRFWDKVIKGPSSGDCWLWIAQQSPDGYGAIKVNGGHVHAHRIAWELTFGTVPDGLLVCHNCPGEDNRLCVNPDHLFLGTRADNIHDMLAKGRSPWMRRERRNGPRLTPEIVALVRKRHACDGLGNRRLSQEFGIPRGTILHILRGTTWAGMPAKEGVS